ncbi:hypothetical protein ACF3OE_06445 [Capnocytophaga canis]|uniref:hypothetical protein n=1 Tax=Capnocytophaga canis TaxID=1848903 RepID=UPI00370D89B3
MKISIKISKQAAESLHFAIQRTALFRPKTRDERSNKSILDEVAHKVSLFHHNFTGNKPKKLTLKYHQASALEQFLRGFITLFFTDSMDYFFLHKIANDLHQKLI